MLPVHGKMREYVGYYQERAVLDKLNNGHTQPPAGNVFPPTLYPCFGNAGNQVKHDRNQQPYEVLGITENILLE